MEHSCGGERSSYRPTITYLSLANVYISSSHRTPIASQLTPIASYRTQLTLYAAFSHICDSIGLHRNYWHQKRLIRVDSWAIATLES
ncbi:hypothetical protein, partial [Paenibacillus odorifer]|uniref:hypothetical protein n=1 Tax=Paenibacillus odorifer TaxID=189426 RepID=UPI001C37C319